MVEQLNSKLAEVQEENAALKGLDSRPSTGDADDEEDDEDPLQTEARNLFIGGMQSGDLSRALSGETEQESLRRKAQETLTASLKKGQLGEELSLIRPATAEEEPDDGVLQGMVLKSLTEAADSGALAVAMEKVQGGHVLKGGSFSTYYTGKILPNMKPAAWDKIYSRFGNKPTGASAAAAAPVEAKPLDLSHVQALHMELEQLAKDRAALMEMVTQIRDKVEEVGKENKKLANEVLSRPLSPTSERQKAAAAKYTQ